MTTPPTPWNGTLPRSRLFDALSLLLPAAETFLVETLDDWRASAGAIASAPLLAEVDRFVREERAHRRAHERYNRRVLAALPRAGPIAERAAGVADELRHFDLSTRLALAVAFEQLTAVLSHEVLAHRCLVRDNGSTEARLWHWHAAEELAHCHVAAEAAASFGCGRAQRARWLALAAAWLGFDLLRCWLALCRCDIAAGAKPWRIVRDAASFLLLGAPAWLRMIVAIGREFVRAFLGRSTTARQRSCPRRSRLRSRLRSLFPPRFRFRPRAGQRPL